MTQDDGALNDQSSIGTAHLPGIVPRPAGHLRALPLRYRWETTRRHPYYLAAWDFASGGFSLENERAVVMSMIHLSMLGAIGVSGADVPPDTPFDSLEINLGASAPAWLSGSVQSMSFRGLTGLLLAHLSHESRCHLAELFRRSTESHEEFEEGQLEALLELQQLTCEELDTFADQPIVAISPVVTVNALMTDLGRFLDDWRRRHGLTERRVRVDCFDQYLSVWDARECWTGSGYETGDSHTLAQVARDLGIPLGTARNQYRAAFELITGHPYSVAKWLRISGPIKFPADVMNDINGRVMNRRMQPRHSRPPVPASVIMPNTDQAGSGGLSPAVGNDDLEMRQLIEDLQILYRAGRSDVEIADELELHLNSVRALRGHLEDSLEAVGSSGVT